MRTFVQTKTIVPPGGYWFFQYENDSVRTPIYEFAVRRVGEILRKHGIKASAAQTLAEFMCPQMPAWFCRGEGPVSPVISGFDAREEAVKYLGRNLVTADVIIRRMECCQACKKHRRDFCLHCDGHDAWISNGFRGHRPHLAVDDASGCCQCAGTFEAVIASVEYKENEPVWKGAPENCWRYLK